jgi:Leucine carboxyl methyltransferase
VRCAGLADTRHPLKAASYASLAADLREAGWTRGLQAQGFDPSVPTVWLAEVTARTDRVAPLPPEAIKGTYT